MKKLINAFSTSMEKFSAEEDGAQVVEYALIIAVVSIALVIALGNATGLKASFTALVTRVTTCLQTGGTCT